jgi:signal transduction histidine kinase
VEQVEQYQAAPVEDMLGALAALARQLATVEYASMLPVALQEFLALWRARRGLVLTRPGGAAAQVAAAQELPEEMAEWLTHEPRFWGGPSIEGACVTLTRSASAAGEQASAEPFARRLAAAGVTWYTWQRLTLPERGEAVLVALGEGNPPPAAECGRLWLAAGMLADLVAAALERAHLRQVLASRERARDEFIGLASHELKSPLTVIKGYSQLLLRQARRGDSAGSVDLSGLEAISQQVSRMSTLVGELLDFSRIERGTLEIEPLPMDVVALVRRVVEQRQRALPDVSFSLTAREPQLIALADRVRLEQVLGYLLDNAVKFGQEGVVEVAVQRVMASLLPSSITSATPADGGTIAQEEVALISVRDYGPGLPDEERDKLFTAFYRGPANSFQRQLAGLGLGLYLSHYLVARQNGHLWADFPLGGFPKGSTFYLTLPLPAAS